jgi:hypothetical protein
MPLEALQTLHELLPRFSLRIPNPCPEDHNQEVQMAEAATKVREQAQEVTSKATEVTSKATDQVRNQVDQRSTDLGQKVASTATDIRAVGDHLREQGKDQPAKLAERAAHHVERAGAWLRDSDSDRILNDAEDFGRRKPWAVAAGGLAMGMFAARFLKASSSKRYQQRSQLAPASSGIRQGSGHAPGLGGPAIDGREPTPVDVTHQTPPAAATTPAPPSSVAQGLA